MRHWPLLLDDFRSLIFAILACSSSQLPVCSVSASFSCIRSRTNDLGKRFKLYNIDVCHSTYILDEIDLCYFQLCIITHNNNLFDKTLMYSRSKFCPQKTPIRGRPTVFELARYDALKRAYRILRNETK